LTIATDVTRSVVYASVYVSVSVYWAQWAH